MAKTRISKEEWRKITARLFANMTPQERESYEKAREYLTRARYDFDPHFPKIIN